MTTRPGRVQFRSACGSFWLVIGLLAMLSCTAADSGTRPAPQVLFSTRFAEFSDTSPLAIARDNTNTEFALYAVADEDGLRVRQIDTLLPGGKMVRSSLDRLGRPTHIEVADGETVSVAFDETGMTSRTVAGIIDKTGNRFTKELSFEPSDAPRAKSALAVQAIDSSDPSLCDLTRQYAAALRAVFSCDDGAPAEFCAGDLADLALAAERVCALNEQRVPESELDPQIAAAPVLPFGTGIAPIVRESAEGVTVELAGAGFGGQEPYQCRWTLETGPELAVIENPDQQFARVTLTVPGDYEIHLMTFDSAFVTVTEVLSVSVPAR